MGFFALVWRILEGIRKVLHLVLLLVIFGFILAALRGTLGIEVCSAARMKPKMTSNRSR